MKQRLILTTKLAGACAIVLALAACASSPTPPQGAADARSKLTRLQADPQLATRAPIALEEAEAAVLAAEQPRKDKALEQHLVFMADRKVELAEAQARRRLLLDERKALSEARDAARLEARTLEADRARSAADYARTDADQARREAAAARLQATTAREDAAEARREAEELANQIEQLNARETERGLIVTLGDVLFDTDEATLREANVGSMARLASFLQTYEDRAVQIEGHTDNVGSDDYNLGLSQRRAMAVKEYLVNQGISASRLEATGKGESNPVASNDSATGRQQNRRVEVIIENDN